MEINVPHDREARMHEQKPFSGLIKAREGHGKGGILNEKTREGQRNEQRKPARKEPNKPKEGQEPEKKTGGTQRKNEHRRQRTRARKQR
ncbi:hypothetical protein NC653_025815 [Populus alba x Populus x berolinensis]|uniref:Uncharacterized protein n=1 Tax=Populus alba x Populus x berolinensis TaxID=444605 RepID=A0AAD6Q9H7_9ROSI|nr:hypothetical protein NC653_025815 [Populus alba x Populus x berolinensis]